MDHSLNGLYGASSGPVIFIDESYRTPNQAIGGNSFYILTGVVVARPNINLFRSELEASVGGDRWHTTEMVRQDGGRAKVVELNKLVARHSTSIVALKRPVPTKDRDGEQARFHCFGGLFSELSRQGALSNDSLVVYERRRDTGSQDADKRFMAKLISASVLPRNASLASVSPASETLLWAPDLVSWSMRQYVAIDDTTFAKPFKSRMTLVSVK